MEKKYYLEAESRWGPLLNYRRRIRRIGQEIEIGILEDQPAKTPGASDNTTEAPPENTQPERLVFILEKDGKDKVGRVYKVTGSQKVFKHNLTQHTEVTPGCIDGAIFQRTISIVPDNTPDNNFIQMFQRIFKLPSK